MPVYYPDGAPVVFTNTRLIAYEFHIYFRGKQQLESFIYPYMSEWIVWCATD